MNEEDGTEIGGDCIAPELVKEQNKEKGVRWINGDFVNSKVD